MSVHLSWTYESHKESIDAASFFRRFISTKKGFYVRFCVLISYTVIFSYIEQNTALMTCSVKSAWVCKTLTKKLDNCFKVLFLWDYNYVHIGWSHKVEYLNILFLVQHMLKWTSMSWFRFSSCRFCKISVLSLLLIELVIVWHEFSVTCASIWLLWRDKHLYFNSIC